jgi:hypothetical protein
VATSRSANLNIRARPREMKKWKVAAKRADETLSEWMGDNRISMRRCLYQWRWDTP